MELNKTLELLKTFADINKIQEGAVSLLGSMVQNNVSADNAYQFCQEHFMSSNIADYYIQFYDYVVDSLDKGAQKATEDYATQELTKDETCRISADLRKELQEINNTLKEVVKCLQQLTA